MLKWVGKRGVSRGVFAGVALLALLLLAGLFFPQQILCVDSGDVQADAMVVLGGGTYERPTRAAELFQAGAAPRIVVSGAGDAGTNERFLVTNGVPPEAIELEGKSRSTRENALFSIRLLRGSGGNAEMLKAEGRRTDDGGQRTEGSGSGGKAETLKAEKLKAGGRRTEGGGQRTEDGRGGPAGAKRVIIVTSWYHSSRALHTFQHYAPDIQFYSRPSYYGYPRAQWSREGITGYIRSEYVKLAGYWVCYGVWPF